MTPSYVAFDEQGERLIGDAAKKQLSQSPENTVFGVKRILGRSSSDPTVEEDAKNVPFNIDLTGELPQDLNSLMGPNWDGVTKPQHLENSPP